MSRDRIRVTLFFGARADTALCKELSELRPYARAKLLRRLVAEGWRLRMNGHSPHSTTSHVPRQQGVPLAGCQDFGSDVQQLLAGKAVR